MSIKLSKFLIFFIIIFFTTHLNANHQRTLFNKKKEYIKVGLVLKSPFVSVKNGIYTGISYDIWKSIAKLNNFDCIYTNAGEITNKAIDDLNKGKYDVLVGGIGFYSYRYDKGFLSLPLLIDEYVIVAKKTKNNFFKTISILFDGHFFFTFLIVFLLYFSLLNIFWWKESQSHPEITKLNYLDGISYLFWQSSINNKFSYPIYPTHLYTKILSLLWNTLLLSIIFTITSGLTSTFILKLQKNNNQFIDLQTLKDEPIVINGGPTTFKIAQENQLNIIQTAFNMKDAVTKLDRKQVKAIFTKYSFANSFILENRRNDLYIAPVKFPNFQNGLMINSKKYELFNKINQSILKIAENNNKKYLCQKYKKYIKLENCFWY